MPKGTSETATRSTTPDLIMAHRRVDTPNTRMVNQLTSSWYGKDAVQEHKFVDKNRYYHTADGQIAPTFSHGGPGLQPVIALTGSSVSEVLKPLPPALQYDLKQMKKRVLGDLSTCGGMKCQKADG